MALLRNFGMREGERCDRLVSGFALADVGVRANLGFHDLAKGWDRNFADETVVRAFIDGDEPRLGIVADRWSRRRKSSVRFPQDPNRPVFGRRSTCLDRPKIEVREAADWA